MMTQDDEAEAVQTASLSESLDRDGEINVVPIKRKGTLVTSSLVPPPSFTPQPAQPAQQPVGNPPLCWPRPESGSPAHAGAAADVPVCRGLRTVARTLYYLGLLNQGLAVSDLIGQCHLRISLHQNCTWSQDLVPSNDACQGCTLVIKHPNHGFIQSICAASTVTLWHAGGAQHRLCGVGQRRDVGGGGRGGPRHPGPLLPLYPLIACPHAAACQPHPHLLGCAGSTAFEAATGACRRLCSCGACKAAAWCSIAGGWACKHHNSSGCVHLTARAKLRAEVQPPLGRGSCIPTLLPLLQRGTYGNVSRARPLNVTPRTIVQGQFLCRDKIVVILQRLHIATRP